MEQKIIKIKRNKIRKEHKKQKIWFILNTILTGIYLYWRIGYTIPFEYGIVSTVSGIILITIEFMGAIEAFIHYYNMNDIRNPELPVIPEEEYPDVDVFIATYNENVDILYKTVNGCLHMDYPDKSKVHIYLCDDGRRQEVNALASKMGVNYLDRSDNKGAKAGNLNNALKHSTSPLIATLDADMIPNHNFLMRLVPYFVDAEIKNREREEKDHIHIGFVQSPQSFYNPDLFQFYLYSENRIPNEQDYFYKDVQVARNKSNSPIYGGSNTMISRHALDTIGGFYTNSITEDFATGILIQKAKYKCIAISEVLASGLSATTLTDLIQQRVRWARGVISTSKKMHLVFSRKLTIAQKINYLASLWYWYFPFKIFVYIMAPIMFSVFGYSVIDCTLPEILIFWLPMYICSSNTLKLLSGNIRTGKWSRVYETVLFPFMFFPVLFETFGITMKKFKVTSKMVEGKQNNLKYSIPIVIFLTMTALGIVNCIRIIFETSSLSVSVVLFWLIANSYSLIMSLFFVVGRKMMRKTERVATEHICQITAKGRKIIGITKDLSEEGVAILLPRPFYFDDTEEINLSISSERYQTTMYVKVVYVDETNGKWRYAFKITQLKDTDKATYFQLLYDRAPSLPINLQKAISSFDDLTLNLKKRTSDISYAKRSLVRIPIGESYPTEAGDFVKLVNFNYRYVALEAENTKLREKIILSDELVLDCRFEKNIQTGLKLYSVSNFEELMENTLKRNALEEWLLIKWKEKETDIQQQEESGEKSEHQEFVEMDYL